MERTLSSLMVGVVLWGAMLSAFSGTAGSQAAGHRPSEPLVAGQVIERVLCAGLLGQSYALYLPSNYTPSKRWPILYAFDPGARGRIPVTLYKDAAEKHGYIVAGSNNSQNFTNEPPERSIFAIWQDTHQRFSLDEHRTYTTGFSGGARTATMVALRCPVCAVAGVIAHGAGYPNSDKPSQKDAFLYFAAVGNQDFNWGEIVELRRVREELGLPYRVEVFDGEHQWAPAEIVEEAIEWMQLKAMQMGSLPRDDTFIGQFFSEMEARAKEVENRRDAIAQLSAYRSLVSDFSGLREVGRYGEKLAALKRSALLKEAFKKEQDEIREQESLIQTMSGQLSRLGDIGVRDQSTLRESLREGMSQLEEDAAHSKNTEKRLVRLRAFHDLWAQGIEAGQAELLAKHSARAENYFQLMADVAPDAWWPLLLLAETRSAMGNHKQAIKDLREGIRRGLKNAEVIEKDESLQPLRSEPEFQKMLSELAAK
jgi:dienelactone hydrolase